MQPKELVVCMMTDLDEKLLDILNDNGLLGVSISGDFSCDYDKVVEKIKQAFKDAGYICIPKETREDWAENDKLFGLMDGQEWYDRFEKELPEPYRTNRELDPHGHETPNGKYASQGEKSMHSKALFAARRASGLE